MRTVVPETDDRRMGFVTVGNDLIAGFEEAKDRGDNNVEGDDNMIGLLRPPLEVMLCSYLNGGREREREGYDGFVVSKVE